MTNSVQTKPWLDALKLCEKLAASRGHTFEPMVELVRFSFSNETLCIGRTPNFTINKDELRICLDDVKQVFTFTHAKSPDEKYPWSLSCPAMEWKSTFERLVHKRLRWFHEG